MAALGALMIMCLASLAWVAAAGADASPLPSRPSPARAARRAPTPRIRVTVTNLLGRSGYALSGRRLVVRGVTTRYASGQHVSVRFLLNGRRVGIRSLHVLPFQEGREGEFELGYVARAGLLTVRVVHAQTRKLRGARVLSRPVRVLNPNLNPGARGPAVSFLQNRLAGLHYAVSRSGVFDDATGLALIAYQKVTGQPLTGVSDARIFGLLVRRAGTFHVLYPGDGTHVEANLTQQVLAEINRGGHVRLIYDMSSGKPSTPTVLGRFHVYEKTPGINSEGMVDSNYFIRGYAIHGYAEVPNYAASHGCLRIPIPDAPAVFSWVRVGYAVDVYSGGAGAPATQTVSANAGP
jgi:peptidoglycan hydrolase-like protein with peptidoglycan-binding domain